MILTKAAELLHVSSVVMPWTKFYGKPRSIKPENLRMLGQKKPVLQKEDIEYLRQEKRFSGEAIKSIMKLKKVKPQMSENRKSMQELNAEKQRVEPCVPNVEHLNLGLQLSQ